MAGRVRIVDRSDLILRIRMACRVRLYDDARQNILTLVETYGKQLTSEERDLFAVFYKELLNKFRDEYRRYAELLEQTPPERTLLHRLLSEKIYLTLQNLNSLCEEVINIIDTHIIHSSTAVNMTIYFMKLRADYYRYWAEIVKPELFGDFCSQADKAYRQAYRLANKSLAHLHDPLRLGIMVNMSIFHYEVQRDRLKGIQIAMRAVTEGKEHISENSDIHVAVKLLRENLDTWMSVLGPEEVDELERLEGARKWFGKERAVPTEHLIRQLSNKPPPTLLIADTVRQRQSSIPQPYLVPSLIRFKELEPHYAHRHYQFLQRDFPHLYSPVAEAAEPHDSTSEFPGTAETQGTTFEIQSATTEMQSTIAETQSSAAIVTTTVTSSAAPRTETITVYWNPYPLAISKKNILPLEPSSSAVLSDSVSCKKQKPDLFDGILQLTISSASSPRSSQSQEEDDEEDNDEPEGEYLLAFHRSAAVRTSAPHDIPRLNPHVSTSPTADRDSAFSRSGLIGRLRSFESRIRAQIREGLNEEQLPAHPRGEWRITPPDEEQNSTFPELPRPNRVTVSLEPQIPPKIIIAATSSSAYNDPQEANRKAVVPSGIRRLQAATQSSSVPQQRSLPTRLVWPNNPSETQNQYATISRYRSFSDTQAQYRSATDSDSQQIHLTLQHCQNASRLKAPDRIEMVQESVPSTSQPQIILTRSGPKIIGNLSISPSAEGAVAALSPSPPPSGQPEMHFESSKKSRDAPCPQRRQRKLGSSRQEKWTKVKPRSSHEDLTAEEKTLFTQFVNYLSPDVLNMLKLNIIRQKTAAVLRPSNKQTSAERPGQGSGQEQTSETTQRKKIVQYKRLRRSFSAPRRGAPWPRSSLVRQPPRYIHKVLRQASAPDGQTFGRRFLSAHSSAEDLYDEAAEKTFPDPWAPRGTITMRNSFPIIQWHPQEKPRVPWIRFRWPGRTIRSVQYVALEKPQFFIRNRKESQMCSEMKQQQSPIFQKAETETSCRILPTDPTLPPLTNLNVSDSEQISNIIASTSK